MEWQGADELTSDADCIIPAAVCEVLDLLGQRASLMRAVAANKFADSLAREEAAIAASTVGGDARRGASVPAARPSVYVARQEIVVMEKIQALAQQLGLPRYAMLAFAQIQMDYAKLIQEHWLEVWTTHHELESSHCGLLGDSAPRSAAFRASESFPSLEEVRASIAEIDRQLYPAIRSAAPLLNEMLVTKYGPYAVSSREGPRNSGGASGAAQQEAIIDALGRLLDAKTREHCGKSREDRDGEAGEGSTGVLLPHCGCETVNYNRVVVEALCSLARGVCWDLGQAP
eukprot:gnl/TRDRNA2_/TRDRNA2_149313_c0_seq2.p1 gnl/TRDRNA2_/TRDRNA2_149313_c0~~gnl/TRDRNA2_/TRDRNA2_149313_c0_seq2.p1  ORF type:complete len:287 (+),score=46.73 gnl/TRDRNA2_/TRDRNA2_149313_c0_seq2:93-953(+)